MNDYIICRAVWFSIGGYSGTCWAFFHQGFYQHIFFLWFAIIYVVIPIFVGLVGGLICRYLGRKNVKQ